MCKDHSFLNRVSPDKMQFHLKYLYTLIPIEGFHDAVRTPYTLRPGRHVGFFWNNKICFNFVSILFEKIKLMASECTYIIVPMVKLGFMKFKQQ